MHRFKKLKYLFFCLPFSIPYTFLAFVFLIGRYPVIRKKDFAILAVLLLLFSLIIGWALNVAVKWFRKSSHRKVIMVLSGSLAAAVFLFFYAPIIHPAGLEIHPALLFFSLFSYLALLLFVCLEEDKPNRIYLLGGVIFVTVFVLMGFTKLGLDNYFSRDDGLITLSHGKNLAEYGFIGVNPSGERVEGYSAPVQFFFYYLLYLVTHINFFAYNVFQNILFSFLLGILFIKLLGTEPRKSLFFAFVTSLILAAQASFIGWQGSGMENAITHVLFAAASIFLFQSLTHGKEVSWWQAAIIFLASISRLESIYHIAVLLAVYALLWYFQNKNLRGIKPGVIVLVSNVLFHLWRYIYFGDVLSNTAYAQEISIIENIKLLFTTREHLLTIYGYTIEILKSNGLLMVVSLAAILMIRTPDSETGKRDWASLVFWVPVLTGLFYPFLFGKTRIDIPRTTTFMTPLVLFLLMYTLNKTMRPFNSGAVFKIFGFSVLVSVISLGITPYYYLGWNYKIMDETRKTLLYYAEENAIYRPTMANPDIGVITWYKQFNVLDLGWLGNSVIIKIDREDELDYILNKMAPDLIELKANWSLRYNNLTQSPQFTEQYIQVEDWGFYRKNPRCPQGIWVRRDILKGSGTPERALLDKMNENIDVSVLAEEAARAASQNIQDMSYISRTAYHYLPEIVDRGQYDELLTLFWGEEFSEFDRYLIESRINGQAYKDVIAYYANN